MNDETDGGRRQAGRASALAAAVVGTALVGTVLLAAACAGPPSTGAGTSPTESYYQQALNYSACMRSHGDPAWPDPGPQGAFPNVNGSLDRTSAAYKAAATACRKLQPTGGPPAAGQQQALSQLLKYSACMRAHGILNFPDPTDSGGGVGITVNGKSIDQKSPQFTAANQACRSLMPGPGGAS